MNAQNHLADFDNLPWINAGKGIKYKLYKDGNHIIRLMELTDDYCDNDWCTHGHMAYILDGSFIVKFQDHVEKFKKGDTICIPLGECNKHIASVEKGSTLTMISFEI